MSESVETAFHRLAAEVEATADLQGKRLEFCRVVADAVGAQGYDDIPYEVRVGIAEVAFNHRDRSLTGTAEVEAYSRRLISMLKETRSKSGWKLPPGVTMLPFEQWSALAGGFPFFDALAKSVGIPYDKLFGTLGGISGTDRIRWVKDMHDRPGVFLSNRTKDPEAWSDEERPVVTALLDAFAITGDFMTSTGEIIHTSDREYELKREADRIKSEEGSGVIVEHATFDDWYPDSKEVVAALGEDLKMSRSRIVDMMRALESRGCILIHRIRRSQRFGSVKPFYRMNCIAKHIGSITDKEKELFSALTKRYESIEYGKVSVLNDYHPMNVPTGREHMIALEAQYSTLLELSRIAKIARKNGMNVIDGFDVQDLFEYDCVLLRRADTFCWFENPTIAALIAGEQLPADDVRMTRDLMDALSGWWYFEKALAIQTTTQSHSVRALLWSWVELAADRKPMNVGNTPIDRSGIYFSAYVDDDPRMTQLNARHTPTTRFFWPEGKTLREAVEYFRGMYRANYGPGGVYLKPNQTVVCDKEKTCAAVETICRMFAAGCLWIQQKVLTETSGHIERHERKRLEQDVFNRRVNNVRVVQLRRREYHASLEHEEPGARKVVNWTCQWRVNGYWWKRGKYEGNPKWVNGHWKGPKDKPLKAASRTIYVVSR